jgi:acyl carrier protein
VSSSASALVQRLRTLIAETIGVDEDEVVADASFEDDLNADEQEIADLFVAIEEEFGLEIPEDEMAGLRTFGDAVEYLEERLA